jgi:hypothetical protein
MIVKECGFVFGGEGTRVSMPVRNGKVANVAQGALLRIAPRRTFEGQFQEHRIQIQICPP